MNAGLKGFKGRGRRRGGKRRGRGTYDSDRPPVFTLKERGGPVIFEASKRVTSSDVADRALRHVEPGSTVFTDEYRSYGVLGSLGYRHVRVDHSSGLYADGDAHVNGAEGCNRRFRRFIEGAMGVSKRNLGQYCNAVTVYANSYAVAPRLGIALLAALVSVSALFEDCLRLTSKRKLYNS